MMLITKYGIKYLQLIIICSNLIYWENILRDVCGTLHYDFNLYFNEKQLPSVGNDFANRIHACLDVRF